MKLKVLEKVENCLPHIIKQGDWIDLTLAENVVLKAPYIEKLKRFRQDDQSERIRQVTFNTMLASLGVCIEIPKGFEAILTLRSSTPAKWGVMQTNAFGVIDNSYKGDDDIWKLPLVALRDTTIPKGTRIAQFRIQPNQKATFWQKIKWLFSSHITIKQVTSLNNPNRFGFGHTGTNNL